MSNYDFQVFTQLVPSGATISELRKQVQDYFDKNAIKVKFSNFDLSGAASGTTTKQINATANALQAIKLSLQEINTARNKIVKAGTENTSNQIQAYNKQIKDSVVSLKELINTYAKLNGGQSVEFRDLTPLLNPTDIQAATDALRSLLQGAGMNGAAVETVLASFKKGCWDVSEAAAKAADAVQKMQVELADEIHFQQYMQYLFYTQWNALKSYANKNHIRIIGDIPIYVAMDSADVWAHPELFRLDEDRRPYEVAGCPPDGFSETGQLWGNPIYDWELNRQTGYSWWIARMRHSYKLYDVVRIDHFRGFDEYYAIPYGEETAVNGKWKKGPGMDLFRNIEKALGKRDVIAEDLGFVTDSVRKLVHDSGFPGMKVVEFAFDVRDTGAASDYLPHNYIRNCVVYTGTHDNETLIGWWSSIDQRSRDMARDYMAAHYTPDRLINVPFITLAMRSIADLCIIPMQDYLGLDNKSRMNKPSTVGDNWRWRMISDDTDDDLAEEIGRLTLMTGRSKM